MANWFERARREIPQSADGATAKTDERTLSAVAAVPEPGKFESSSASIGSDGSAPVAVFPEIQVVNAVTADQESAIRSWLAQIEETDEAIIARVLNRCSTDPDAFRYFFRCSQDLPRTVDLDDDRRCCSQCRNLTERGLCLAAWRGAIVADRSYEPVPSVARRCEGYMPQPSDHDRRSGRQRWPGLSEVIGDANEIA